MRPLRLMSSENVVMAVEIKSLRSTVKVTDGAWGTQLDTLGCPPGYCREEWNLSHPQVVRQVAEAYVRAGSEVILTNTFSGNRIVLERHGLADKVEQINRAGAEISRQAAGEHVWVFGSIGPTGKMVMAEEVSDQQLYEVFAEQAKALAAGGVDAIVCETMTELAEILAAIRAVKDATGLPVVASMTFDSGPEGDRTVMGVSAAEAAERLTEAGADAVGCNCGTGIDHYIKIAGILRQHTDLPVWVKPNAGLPELHEGKVVYREGPDEFAAKVPALLEAGANFVGGCCGTTPAHIEKVSQVVSRLRSRAG